MAHARNSPNNCYWRVYYTPWFEFLLPLLRLFRPNHLIKDPDNVNLYMEQLGTTSIDVTGTEAKIDNTAGRRALNYLRELAAVGMPNHPSGVSGLANVIQGRGAIQHMFSGQTSPSNNRNSATFKRTSPFAGMWVLKPTGT